MYKSSEYYPNGSSYKECFAPVGNKKLKMIVYSVKDNAENERRIKEVRQISSKQDIDLSVDLEDKVSPFHFRVIHNRYKKIWERCLNNPKYYRDSFVVITQDDTYLYDNFLENVFKTIETLPDNWSLLHLCPGCFWKKDINIVQGIRKKYPGERAIQVKTVFENHKDCWMGNPVAFIFPIAKTQELYDWYKRETDDFQSKEPDDTIFNFARSVEHPETHYVALDPLFCESDKIYRTTLN